MEDYGIWGAFKKIICYAFGMIIYEKRVYRVYRIKLTNYEPVEPSPSDFEYRMITDKDKNVIDQIEDMAEWLEGELAGMLRDKAICLAALENDKLAGFNIVNFGNVYIPLIKMNKSFHDSEAWSEHIAVHKDFRKRGLASQLRYRILAELKKRGVKRFYGGTLRHNEPALKLTRRVGFKELVDVSYIKMFGIKRWKYEKVKN